MCERVWATQIADAADRRGEWTQRTPRVLVADDSPEMLMLVGAWLEDEGCVVIPVGSGREALAAAATYRPDVAFLDVVLPAPDGVQVCEILTRGALPNVVLMTGLSNPDSRRINQAGALLLLRKPLTRETVVDALTLALDRSRRTGASARAAS